MNEMELYRVQVNFDVKAWFREEEDAKAYADALYDQHGESVTIGVPYSFTPLTYGAAGWTSRLLSDREKNVHLTHCCPVHGCEYGEDVCPVTSEELTPTYPAHNGCEECEFDAYFHP